MKLLKLCFSNWCLRSVLSVFTEWFEPAFLSHHLLFCQVRVFRNVRISFLFHHLLLSGSGFPKHGKYDFSMLSLARTSGREAGITANPSCDPWGPSCILVGILMECYTILFSKTFKRKWMSTFKHQKYKHVPTAFKRWWFFESLYTKMNEYV